MRRSYEGGAVPDTLQSAITSTGLVITGANMIGWPTGANGPFTVTLGRGTATEEKVLCESRTGSTLTVAAARRGYDGTTAQAHDVGTLIEHTGSAIDLDEANDHVNRATGVHGLAAGDPVVGEAHTQTLTNKTLDFAPASGNVIENVPLSAIPDVDDAVNAALPVGAMTMWPGAAPPVGWLRCDGAVVTIAAYPALFTVLGSKYGGDGATTFALPDLRGRSPFGVSAEAEFDERGKTGGAKTHTLTTGEMPSHAHDIKHTHPMGAHSHTMAHTHQVDPPLTNTGAETGHVHNIDADIIASTSHLHGNLGGVAATEGGPSNPGTSGIVGVSSGHTHPVNIAAFTSGGSSAASTGDSGAGSATGDASNDNSLTAGSGQAHNNLPPYMAIDFIIRAVPTAA